MKLTPWLLKISSLLCVAAIVGGLWLTGGPGHQRQLRMDERRITQLNELSQQIDTFYNNHQALPTRLSELAKGTMLEPTDFQDPETEESFGYQPKQGRQYELCATFNAPTRQRKYAYEPAGDKWAHPAGRHCFPLQVPEQSR